MVSVYYNEKLGKMRALLNEDNCAVIQGETIDIAAVYVRPPPAENTTEMVEKLERCLQLIYRNGRTVLVGGFSVRLDRPHDSCSLSDPTLSTIAWSRPSMARWDSRLLM